MSVCYTAEEYSFLALTTCNLFPGRWYASDASAALAVERVIQGGFRMRYEGDDSHVRNELRAPFGRAVSPCPDAL